MSEENVQAGSFTPSNNPAVSGATPGDGAPLHQGEKVTLTLKTAYLQSSGYTDIEFRLEADDNLSPIKDSAEHPGLIVFGGQQYQQKVGAGDDYKLDAVVKSVVAVHDTGQYTQWNVAVTSSTNQGLATLTLTDGHQDHGSYGYPTSDISAGAMLGRKAIPAGVATFAEGSAVKVDGYQINDASGHALAKTFAGYIRADNDTDLNYFDFWDSGKTKLTKYKIDNNNSLVWVESDVNGKFTFYITCNYTGGMYADNFTLYVGTQDPGIVEVLAGDNTDVNTSANLPAPKPLYAEGSDLYLSPTDTLVPIEVPNSFIPATFQQGDKLILLVNGTTEIGTMTPPLAPGAGQGNPIKHAFTIDASTLNVSATGAQNLLQYLSVRDGYVTKSSSKQIIAIGSTGNGPSPMPPTQGFAPPKIPADPRLLELTYDDVQNGLDVTIDWSGSGYTPNPGDIISLVIVFDGWLIDGSTPQPATIPYKVPSPVPSSKSITQTVDYSYFAGFVEDTNSKQKSKMFMQYHIPEGRNQPDVWSEPTPWIEIDTVPPGGL